MSKAEILANIQNALADVQEKSPLADVPKVWQTGLPIQVSDATELFIDRLIDYKANVLRAANQEEIPQLVYEALSDAAAKSCCVPAGLPREWLSAVEKSDITLSVDSPSLSKEALDGINAVVTACCVCMAKTGTIVLDHSEDQGRRIISLLPDTHVCVVRAAQIASDVPEAMAIQEAAIASGQAITWISGPSATSDIELSRVEGVHGPRNLYVIIVGD